MKEYEKGEYPESDVDDNENDNSSDNESVNEGGKGETEQVVVDFAKQRPNLLKDDKRRPKERSHPRLGITPTTSGRRLQRQRQSLIKFKDAIAAAVAAPVRIVRKKFPRVEHFRDFRDRFWTDADAQETPAPIITSNDEEPLPDVLTTMTEMWNRNVFDTATIKDVPRLIDRVSVKTGKDEMLLKASDHDFSTRKNIARYIGKVANTIAENMESEEEAAAVAEAVDALLGELSDDSESDQTDFVGKLISAIGEDSKTVKVFKCIHQSIIAQALYVISKGVLNNKHLYKDVRGPEGWNIMITLGDYVQVAHTRREQSLFSGDNHWEFEWQAILSFDKGMHEMTGARLLIKNLELSETMDETLASELSNLMQNGNLFIS